jgi:hypothetical protein
VTRHLERVGRHHRRAHEKNLVPTVKRCKELLDNRASEVANGETAAAESGADDIYADPETALDLGYTELTCINASYKVSVEQALRSS